MKKILSLILQLVFVLLVTINLKAQNPWEKYKNNQTVSYKEATDFYRQTAKNNSNCKLFNFGTTDVGKPLELFVISKKRIFNREIIRKSGGCVILINNGIHPGEPDGIDASIKLTHDIIEGRIELPDNIVIAIIPIYNIDGSLNSSCCSRVNQNGPINVGFRGNAKNLDLNRDFIKCDSENAISFTKIFQEWDPDVFIDTHVSDGADYQYTMTLIDSQKDKLSPEITKTMQEKLLPALYTSMKMNGNEMSHYVNVFEGSPDKGMEAFLETPRFATGYAALFHSFPFVTETHMLKPFPNRVEATYTFLKIVIQETEKFRNDILLAREKSKITTIDRKLFPISWTLDSSVVDSIYFKGYEAKYKISEITGLQRLYYDQSLPYEKKIPFFSSYKVSKNILTPLGYVIPQAWKEVVDRLKLNGIKMEQIKNDTSIQTEVYYIRDYKTSQRAYEGHYTHSNISLALDTQYINYNSGDYIVYCNQWKNRYIVETLEPEATDAFFVWNFFDGILQQKEWFGDYLFEEKAKEILDANPELKVNFELKRKSDSSFSKDNWAMLTYIYQHSEWYEKSHLRYPIGRLLKK